MILDIGRKHLKDGDIEVHLSRHEIKIVECLAQGGVGTLDRLCFAVWGDNEPVSAEGNLRLLIHRIRRKVRLAGWEPLILNFHSQCYALAGVISVVRNFPAILIPHELRETLESLLYSHPSRAAADRVLAAIVGQ